MHYTFRYTHVRTTGELLAVSPGISCKTDVSVGEAPGSFTTVGIGTGVQRT